MIRITTIVLIIWMTLGSCRILLSRRTSETISNPQAREYYSKAQEVRYKGEDGFQNAIDLLDKADSLEPRNAIIMHERGLVKFNSKLDTEGAFIDLNNSITYSTDEISLQYRYNNRGLCYMEICDIKSACLDWRKSGKLGSYYIDKYCKSCSDTLFQKNSDTNIEVDFKLIDGITKITSTHNLPSMTECKAEITVRNINNEDLKIVGSSLDYGLPEDSCSLYLEAQSQNGEKFIFFKNSTYTYYPSNKETVIKKGTSYSQEQDITYLYQFPYPGIYKVRVAIRPSNILKGIQKPYYSNWEVLKVEK